MSRWATTVFLILAFIGRIIIAQVNIFPFLDLLVQVFLRCRHDFMLLSLVLSESPRGVCFLEIFFCLRVIFGDLGKILGGKKRMKKLPFDVQYFFYPPNDEKILKNITPWI